MARYPEIPLGHTLKIAPGADLTAHPSTYTWQEITRDLSFARTKPINAKRGAADEQSQGTSEFEFALKNPLGRYTTDNAESDLWPNFDLNCPIQHSVDPGNGVVQRTIQYLSDAEDEWPSGTPHLCFANIRADGLFRRLGQGSLLKSPLFRSMSGVSANDYVPYAYWPMEDGTEATRFASGLPGGAPITFTGSVSPGSDDTLPGSDALPVFSTGASAVAVVPTYTSTGQWVVQFVAMVPSEPAATTTILQIKNTGTATTWDVDIVPGTTEIHLRVYNQSGATLCDVNIDPVASGTLGSEADFYGHWLMYNVSALTTGANVEARIQINPISSFSVSAATDMLGISIGIATSISCTAAAGFNGGGTGHWALFTDPAFTIDIDGSFNAAALDGYADENALDRWERLCREEQVPFETTGTTSTVMGRQGRTRLLDQLREIEATDMGRADDSQGVAGYRAQSDLLNQTPALTLDANRRQLFMPFRPKRDDQKIRNLVVASRPNGSSATVKNQSSIDRIGVYDDQITVNVGDDDQLADAAGWRVWLGIQPGKRYPSVTINFLAAYGLVDDWLAMGVGDLVLITNPPLQHAKGDVRLLFTGWSETWHGRRNWSAVANCVPASPYDVGVLDSIVLGRLATGGCATTAELSPTGLSFTASNTDGALWETGGGHYPMDIVLGGEQMTLSGVSGSSNPQTFTISARSVNGIRKLHPVGSSLQAYRPLVLAR